jgi:uncharacterized coiled-coil protein SlyX
VVANPGLNFNKISDMKNCTSAPINWFYSPATQQQPDDLTLTISSDVPGVTDLDELITPEPLDPLARSYTWPSVKAIPGVYQIEARSDSAQWLILSGPFNVVNGIDTLCRAKSTNAVSASSTIPAGQTTTPASQISTTPASQTTTSGPAVTSGAAGSQNKPSPTPTSQTTASRPAVTSGGAGPQTQPSSQTQSKVNGGAKVNGRAIVGGVVGGLAILIAIVIWVIRRRYRTRIPDTTTDVSPFLIPGISAVTQGREKAVPASDAPGVGESQAGSGKRHPMHRDERGAAVDARDGGQSAQASTVNLNPSEDSTSERRSEQQLRAMAERLAAMEAHLRTQEHPEEQPPDYNAESAPPRT